MSLSARDVLNDCYEPINALEGGDAYNWKPLWTSAVTLLRTVGLTLKSIDARKSDRHKDAINRHWAALQQEKESGHIFWDFIDSTRNRLIHEYSGLPVCETKVFGDEYNEIVVLVLRLEDGSDGLPMLREAAEWWEEELAAIEAELDE